jgi:putative ABC transport system permease protein
MSVMERSGEIGLRRALGATRTQIALQIITENTIIGFMGGLIGSAAGTLTVIAGATANHWTPIADPQTDLAAITIGTLTGLLAGLTPAIKAANLEPSTALQEGT